MELTDKVLINNLCAWPLYFRRLNGVGDIKIPGSAKNFSGLDVAEVQMQIQSGNNLFTGTDGAGNHARLQIADEKQRKTLLGYDTESNDDAVVLTVETVKELLAVRRKDEFQKRLETLVKTPTEKKMVEQLAREAGGDEVATWKMEAISKIAETNAI